MKPPLATCYICSSPTPINIKCVFCSRHICARPHHAQIDYKRTPDQPHTCTACWQSLNELHGNYYQLPFRYQIDAPVAHCGHTFKPPTHSNPQISQYSNRDFAFCVSCADILCPTCADPATRKYLRPYPHTYPYPICEPCLEFVYYVTRLQRNVVDSVINPPAPNT